jgi:hypothetical protein
VCVYVLIGINVLGLRAELCFLLCVKYISNEGRAAALIGKKVYLQTSPHITKKKHLFAQHSPTYVVCGDRSLHGD